MPGKSFGRYEIIAELKRGGMSIVYHAHDPRTDRDVALKVLPRKLLHDSNFRERFDREARTIAALEHPAIVPVYDFGEQDSQPYLVMRYMTGRSLIEKLRQGPLPHDQVVSILRRIASALDYAHRQGVIHRDLKPGNILFDQFGESYLADFGIAQLAEGSTKLTGERAFVGTPAYMSPEQVHGEEQLDTRSDIYALGIILFEMLTGKLPFDADTPTRLMMKHVLDPIPPVRTLSPSLPDATEAIITRALAKERTGRYSSANELAEAAANAIQGTAAPKKVRVLPIVGIVAGILSLGCLVSWVYFVNVVLDPGSKLRWLEELNISQFGKSILWFVGGLLVSGAALALTFRLRQRLMQKNLDAKDSVATEAPTNPFAYYPRSAKFSLIAGVVGGLIFFALAVRSCVPALLN